MAITTRMSGWAKVALLACLICASAFGNADGSQTMSAMAKSSAGESCFFYRGVRKWCLGTNYGYAWTPCGSADVDRVDSAYRYWVEEGNTRLGYVRLVRPGLWRGVAVEGAAVRDRWIVRGTRGRWFVSSGGRRLGIARGPFAVAVGAYRLFAGNC